MTAAYSCFAGSRSLTDHSAPPIAQKSIIAKQFGNASKTYEGASRLQRQMGRAMLEALEADSDGEPLRILDLGCGTGWFTRRLSQAWPAGQVTGVDLSPGMIRQAGENDGAMIEWVIADAEALPLHDRSFDLVFSNLMIQWCSDPRPVLAECKRLLRPGGRLMLSTLLDGTLRELKQAWAIADPGQEHVNRFESEAALREQVAAELPGASLAIQTITLPYASPMALAAELRQLGAGFKNETRRKTLTAPGRVREMCRHYPSEPDGTAVASYEAAWVHWQPAD
ncbi:malonyl-ACP O-methyltransferase BioC [Marinobacter sediminum]|nr:malonyl-ACP O-methyltransferase BioC [Marinobacter sediminum]